MLENHTFISGITGSGKTTNAGQLFLKTDGVNIFINTNYETHIEELGANFDKMDDLIKALNDNERKLIYTPNILHSDQFEKLQAVLFALGQSLAGDDRKIWCHVYFDEVQELSDKSGNETIDRFWTRGKRYGIIAIGISQRPALVSQTILTQSFYHVIYELGDYETPYFEKYRIPYEQFKPWLSKKFHYVIKSPTSFVFMKPVKVD